MRYSAITRYFMSAQLLNNSQPNKSYCTKKRENNEKEILKTNKTSPRIKPVPVRGVSPEGKKSTAETRCCCKVIRYGSD